MRSLHRFLDWINPSERYRRRHRRRYTMLVGNPEPISVDTSLRFVEGLETMREWAEEEGIRYYALLNGSTWNVIVLVGNETDAVKVKLRWS